MKYLCLILIFGCTSTKQTITTLNGSKSYDPGGGKIVSYEWRQIAGYDAKIYSPDEAITKVSLPKIGVYAFELYGINESKLWATDTTIIKVRSY